MEKASRSTFGAIHRFTTGLRRDEAAIAAAVLLPWSNGQVEGQVHRLKLIKRQMYGRAGFQLLRRRVLPYKYDHCFANSYRAPSRLATP
jgi:transposase